MVKPNGISVQGMVRHELETVFDELLVLAIDCAIYNLVAAIFKIIEQRVTDVLHVHAYLVRAARLEPAFHQRHVPKTFQYLIVCHRMFARRVVFVHHGSQFPK